MYRVGLPFWKAAARAGVPLKFRVRVYSDKETGTYWAESEDLDGLVVSGETLDELRNEVLSAGAALLELALDGASARATADMRVRSLLPSDA